MGHTESHLQQHRVGEKEAKTHKFRKPGIAKVSHPDTLHTQVQP